MSLLSFRPLVAAVILMTACTGDQGETTKTDEATTEQKESKLGDKPMKEKIPAPADVAAPPADATKTESGLAYKVLTPGSGTEKPTKVARVQVNYTGWTTDGEMFDSSVTRNRPASFQLNAVIAGWTEGLQLMTQGEKTRFWIPEDLAYKGQPGKPAGMLVFDVELLSITNPPPAPPDVAAPPADAKKTASGLAYKMVDEGEGDEHPVADARVVVSFTEWTSDGTVVDSTVVKGRPMTITLSENTFPGFVEAVSLLKKNGKAMFWIPESLVQTDQQPKGTLVYDLQLMSFENPIPAPPDVAAPPADAKKTEKGVSYKILKKGPGGEKPGPEATVTVNYTGWTTDGKMFDTSTKRGRPVDFPLNRVIPGWTDGLQQLAAGDTARLWIPVELAYNNQPNRPAGMLVFDVELVSFQNPPPPIPAPPDVAAAPADATKTESGLAYKVLTPGKGAEKPTAASRVKVHYTGWTTDGKMFDSSVQRGEPAVFPLGGVIKGWTEGLQLMTVGQKNRFWIPGDLAYGEKPARPGAPAGTLVFDVELLEIVAAPEMPPIPGH
ncbi:MAG: FKBP-type peptidyl-prolyl cis-trans isomerase [Alphaproteobacteria bacterium]|nr:FKBP-type peptidyl-prolyl cis-trans isomerase [Alphaproteobacteria bacterium]